MQFRNSNDDIDMLEIPEAVWNAENNNANPNMVVRTSSAQNPPSNACLNIKLIYNDDWIDDSSGGNARLAKQRAIDVLNEAETIYNSKFNPSNRLGTNIKFNLVDGGKLVYCPKNLIKVSKFIVDLNENY